MGEHGGNPETLKRIIKEYGLSEEQLDKNRSLLYSRNAYKTQQMTKVSLQDVFDNKIRMQGTKLLKRLVNEGIKEYKCEMYGINEWLGKPIVLHLHYKDGNHDNNALDNLQALCPNCHTQTDTYAGKNIKNKKISPSNKKANKTEDVINPIYVKCTSCGKATFEREDGLCPRCRSMFKLRLQRRNGIQYSIDEIVYKYEVEHKNFKQIAEELNCDDNCIIYDYKKYKGVNYIYEIYGDREYLKYMVRNNSFLELSRKFGVSDRAIVKWCISAGIPSLRKDIKKYTDEEWKLI